MGRHKKITEVELDKGEEIPEKTLLSQLSGKYYGNFTAETMNHSIQEAWNWVNSVANDKTIPYNVVLQDYYHQKAFGGRGIVVSYNKVDK